ncbi:TonB-dependent receptor plug domain-containing protein [Termitidicoccus mucosus]|uniref:Uncharacterized protein n=1 Tax=Termitidicoccus mucosus TaxID=1184151 RepID=A0A178ILD8_9BACT|nr:hypothetical protein AW736_06570 [Opitutaceae bacterium TSB47]
MKTSISHHQKLRLSPAAITGLLLVVLSVGLPAAPSASPTTSGTSKPAQTPASSTGTDVIEREVYATRDQAGKFVIEQETISMTPSTTGTIEEVLRARSVAQFDLNSRNSELGGEITPPRFSIRGGSYYANNFMINGVSNNNYFGQGGFLDTNVAANSSPMGEAQAIFVNPDLIGAVVVYTDNVPVEYGGFTGGVFDAKIRDPKTDGFHASLNFGNYTRDSWTSQKFAESADPERTTNTNNHQPLFERYSFSASVEGPLTKNIAGFLSYSEVRSIVPVWDTLTPASKFKNHSINRNLLAKLTTYGLDDFHAALTTTYAPYEREWRASSSRKGSPLTSEGGGYSAMLEVEKKLPFGKLSGDVSYRDSDISRDTATNKTFSWANSATNAYANWGGSSATASEGNGGDYEQHQKTFAANAKLAVVEFGPKYFRNNITTGIQFKAIRMERETEDSLSFSWLAANSPSGANRMDPASTGDKENGVITGEQWLNYLVFYGASNKAVSQTEIAAYAEDKIKVERFTATAGIRVDHETFLGTTAWSPRLALNADVLNNGILNIFAGAARYTQSGVPSFKYVLFNNRTQVRQRRANYDAEWEPYQEVTSLPYNTGNLKAPHADAFNLGASTVWSGYVFRLDGSIRRHRDIIRSKPGSPGFTREYLNSGKADYKGVTFEIEKKTPDLGWAGQHNLLLSFTYAKTDSNSREDYAMEENEGGNFTPYFVIYNGELAPSDNLPATNFSTPLVVTFSDMASFWGGRVRLYNTLRFEKGGDGLAQTSRDPSKLPGDPDYNKYYILNDGRDPSQGGAYASSIPTNQARAVYFYTNRKYDNIIFWDMSLDYDVVQTRAGTLTLQLRLTNILNRHDHVDTSIDASGDIYTAGRQLYAGIQYKF